MKGCFASYVGANGIVNLSRTFELPSIAGKESLSVEEIIQFIEVGKGVGYAEAVRVYGILAERIVSWIEEMYKMRGDKRFILTGGVTAGQAGRILSEKINNKLRERSDIKGVSVTLSEVNREYGGAIGAAFFAMSLASRSFDGPVHVTIESVNEVACCL